MYTHLLVDELLIGPHVQEHQHLPSRAVRPERRVDYLAGLAGVSEIMIIDRFIGK